MVVVILVLLNGFFVATEFSLVSVRRTRIDELVKVGNRSAGVVQRALQHLDSFIAATQLGITMASLALGWIGEPALAHLIEPLFAFLPGWFAEATAHTLAVAIAFTIITSLHIVLGELAPKTIALQRPESTALWVARPTEIFLRIFWPFIAVMNGAGNLVVRLVGLEPASEHSRAHSSAELRLLVEESGEAGVLDEQSQEMLINVFAFGNRPAYQAMVPRTEVVTIDADATVRAFLERFATSGHTRFPVLGPGGVDDMQGVVSAKDLLLAMRTGSVDPESSIAPFIQAAFYTPETKHIGELLREMRDRHHRMAILIDEYGGMAGVVTLEDLIEEIVGDIDDNKQDPDDNPQQIDDRTTVVEGQMRVVDANAELGLDIPTGDYETLAGFILAKIGRLPSQGEVIAHGGIRLLVLEMQGPRIKRVEITRV
jgi:putative hemolysin